MPNARMRMTLLTSSIVIALAGCNGASSGPAQSFVGRIEGGPTTALIGLVRQGDLVAAYVCSGEGEFNRRHCHWFYGSLTGDGFDITHDAGPRLSGTIHGENVDGTLHLAADKPLAFEATLVPEAGSAGIYRIAFPNGNTMGWIVDEARWVGGVEMKAAEGTSLGAWDLTPNMQLSAKELPGMLALTASSSPIRSDEIERVLTAQRPVQ